MDVPLPGAEAWDNEICWTCDDIEAADQTVAAVFYEDIEILGGDDGLGGVEHGRPS